MTADDHVSVVLNPDRPLVSIIMATYNCADTLDDAIGSVESQTYSNWELVVCDDGSKDATREKLVDWQSRLGERMTVLLNPENRRLQYSLNRCLDRSRGQLIARMDGDDISLPERIERQVHLLTQRPDVHLVGTQMQRFSEDGLADIVRPPAAPDRLTLASLVPFAHATIVARREVFDSLGGYDESPRLNRVEDIDLWFRFFARDLRGVNIELPLYLVREDLAAIRRRTFRNRWNLLLVTIQGFRALDYPVRLYARPLVAFGKVFVPAPIVGVYRKVQRKRWKRKGPS